MLFKYYLIFNYGRGKKNDQLAQYFADNLEKHKWIDNILDELWKRVEARFDIGSWPYSYEMLKNWTYRIKAYNTELQIPINSQKSVIDAIKLTDRILEEFKWKWNFYQYESILTRWGFISDNPNDADILLQVDDRMTNIADSIVVWPQEFKKVFWVLWNRNNRLVQNYASFLNEIIQSTWWNIERLKMESNWKIIVQSVQPSPSNPKTIQTRVASIK